MRLILIGILFHLTSYGEFGKSEMKTGNKIMPEPLLSPSEDSLILKSLTGYDHLDDRLWEAQKIP